MLPYRNPQPYRTHRTYRGEEVPTALIDLPGIFPPYGAFLYRNTFPYRTWVPYRASSSLETAYRSDLPYRTSEKYRPGPGRPMSFAVVLRPLESIDDGEAGPVRPVYDFPGIYQGGVGDVEVAVAVHLPGIEPPPFPSLFPLGSPQPERESGDVAVFEAAVSRKAAESFANEGQVSDQVIEAVVRELVSVSAARQDTDVSAPERGVTQTRASSSLAETAPKGSARNARSPDSITETQTETSTRETDTDERSD